MFFFLPATAAAMSLLIPASQPRAPRPAPSAAPAKRFAPPGILLKSSPKDTLSAGDIARHGPAGVIVTATRRSILFATTAITKIARGAYSFFSRISEALTHLRMMEAMAAFVKTFTPFGYIGNAYIGNGAWPPAFAAAPFATGAFCAGPARLEAAPAAGSRFALPSPAMFEQTAYLASSRSGDGAAFEKQLHTVAAPFAVMAFALTSALMQTAPQFASAFGV